ncbi:MAG TPA: DsbC family protein [Geobacteraceae bacterium]
MKFFVLVLVLLVAGAAPAFAMPKEGCGGDCSSCHSFNVKEASTLLKGMGGDVKGVKPSAVRGLWEVTFSKDGKQAVAYVDYSKKFIIPGAIYTIATRQPVPSAAQPPRVEKVKTSAIPLTNAIVMGNPRAAKRLILFTDPDCPFCAKQHAELKKLLAKRNDIVVYIKLYPLKIHPKAYDHARVILQAKSEKLLDDNFNGRPIPAPTPQTPKAGVDATMKLAQSLGLNSTPTLILPSGKVLAGFQEAGAIEQALSGSKGK